MTQIACTGFKCRANKNLIFFYLKICETLGKTLFFMNYVKIPFCDIFFKFLYSDFFI